MEKLTWQELNKIIDKHNEEKGINRQYEDKEPLICYAVIKQMPYWQKQYTEEERTYKFRSDNKYFLGAMLGNSIFADCVGDPNDKGVRLDWYLGDWEIEYCYYEESKKGEENEQ